MRYRIKKETKPTLPTYGKYKAVAVHNQTIESRKIFEEAARGTVLSAGALEGLMMNVAEVVRRHLKMGDKVRNGSQELYQDITFEKEPNHVDE